MIRAIWVAAVLTLTSCTRPLQQSGNCLPGTVEFRGVAAGDFTQKYWTEDQLHFVPDSRAPLIEPLPGKYRNIYAPSVVAMADGSYRIFFGGWDETPSGNDQIYSLQASDDFLSFTHRRVVIAHGTFQHVCNVSAVINGDGTFTLMCTAYPDEQGLNKPAVFHVKDAAATRPARSQDIVEEIEAYPPYRPGDLNGMNPILLDPNGRTMQLYFANFRDFGHIYRASSADGGRRFALDGKVLDFKGMPNDVKRIGHATVLALHQNGNRLFYAVSAGDPMRFGEVQELGRARSELDKYIVAVGLVCRGEKVLGYLYGAGPKSSLDHNAIFARWLQRKVVFEAEDGRELTPARALGPDRVQMELGEATAGRVRVYAEDGVTLQYTSGRMTLEPGRAYAVGR